MTSLQITHSGQHAVHRSDQQRSNQQRNDVSTRGQPTATPINPSLSGLTRPSSRVGKTSDTGDTDIPQEEAWDPDPALLKDPSPPFDSVDVSLGDPTSLSPFRTGYDSDDEAYPFMLEREDDKTHHDRQEMSDEAVPMEGILSSATGSGQFIPFRPGSIPSNASTGLQTDHHQPYVHSSERASDARLEATRNFFFVDETRTRGRAEPRSVAVRQSDVVGVVWDGGRRNRWRLNDDLRKAAKKKGKPQSFRANAYPGGVDEAQRAAEEVALSLGAKRKPPRNQRQ